MAAAVFLNKELYEAAKVQYEKDSTLPSFCCNFALLWKLQPAEQDSLIQSAFSALF